MAIISGKVCTTETIISGKAWLTESVKVQLTEQVYSHMHHLDPVVSTYQGD